MRLIDVTDDTIQIQKQLFDEIIIFDNTNTYTGIIYTIYNIHMYI